jgi:hypothetical protein
VILKRQSWKNYRIKENIYQGKGSYREDKVIKLRNNIEIFQMYRIIIGMIERKVRQN